MQQQIRKSRRLFTLAITAVMVALVGCSNSGNGNTDTNTNSQTENVASEGGSKAFDLWMGVTATINNDSLIQKYWKETEPGIEVKLESTQGDAMTALNLKINTGGFKDAALFPNSETVNNAMQRSNQILSLEQYFEMPDKYPNLAKIPKEYLDRMKDENGHIWSIPTWFDQNLSDPWPGWASTGWLVRTDVLEQVGMTKEDLTTIEGVEEFLRKAAGQKDSAGNSLIPFSFLMDPNDRANSTDENAIFSAFGVSTAGTGIEKKGDEFIFSFDNPNYKTAYQWMNKMYREKLIDPEVVTSKKEQYNERNKSGRVAMNAGSFWNVGTDAKGPEEPDWYYEVMPFPKVAGIDNVGINQIIKPYPGWDVYISKETKNLEAILTFMDYALQPKAEMQQIINEGPAGLYWDWVDKELGQWKFTDETYKADRNSGDQALIAKVTPQLWMLSSYSNEWYPWWNAADADDAAKKNNENSETIGTYGGVRVAESHDLVVAKTGGLWEKYWPEVENIRKEYRARLIMAKDDAQFEEAWTSFRDALEKRAHWTDLKTEWHESYKAEVEANGEL